MNVLFIGSVTFSAKALQKLIALDVNLVGVVTKSESSFNADFTDLAGIARENNIDYYHTSDINTPEVSAWIKGKNPDLIFCLGWSQLLKEHLLDIPQRGVVGYHPAELPKNRGRHPLIWAIALGLEQTASTFFIMDKGADTGDIISQKVFPIYFEDEARDVYDRMTATAVNQLEKIVVQFEKGTIQKSVQDVQEGNSWRKRGRKDGEIDFRMSSGSIYNLVRALSEPYVGAHLQYGGEDVKVWETKIEACELANIEPGKVLQTEDRRFLVKTGDDAIWIIRHELTQLPNVGEYL